MKGSKFYLDYAAQVPEDADLGILVALLAEKVLERLSEYEEDLKQYISDRAKLSKELQVLHTCKVRDILNLAIPFPFFHSSCMMLRRERTSWKSKFNS